MTFYSFDTSSFLNGRRDLLVPEVFHSFWTNVEAMIATGGIRAVDIVRDELARREDDIHAWACEQTGLFVPLDENLQLATKEVLRLHPKLVGVGGRRNGADPFVIGLALVHDGTVVTEETPSGRLDKPRIPDVCAAIGIPWINLVGVASAESWTF